MNEICKENTAARFIEAFKKEHLSKGEAGSCIGLTASQVSYIFNKNYWDRLGKGFEKILAWVNSGYSLKEYPKHRPGEALKDVATMADIKKTESINIIGADIYEKEMKESAKIKAKFIGSAMNSEEKPLIKLLKKERELLQEGIDAIDILLAIYE